MLMINRGALPPCRLVWSAHNLCAQIGFRSGQTICQAGRGMNPFDTQMVFLKHFFEKVDFEKNQQTTKSTKKSQGAKRHL